MKTLVIFICFTGLLFVGMGHAEIEPLVFNDPAQEARYKGLIEELRCLVCQNQSLADSDAPLAYDLRREVFQKVTSGASDKEVVDFLVNRYGDFVLYRPPLKASTYLLWIGPFILLAFAVWRMLSVIRRKSLNTDKQ